MSGYDHTQRAPMHWILWAVVVLVAGIAWLTRGEPGTLVPLGIVECLCVIAALAFKWLRVCDAGEALLIAFGPLPLARKRIRYSDVAGVEMARSTLVDGWGIHYVIGRGWIWNLWGRDCARLTLRNGRHFRIGTDDPAGLVAFLESRIGSGHHSDQ